MKDKKKKIILYPFEKERHSLHKDIVELLAKNYDVIYNPIKGKRKITPMFKLTKSYLIRRVYHKLIRKYFTFNQLKYFPKKSSFKKTDADLIYSVAKIPPFENNYIIDFEKITSMADHSYERLNKEFLEESFSKKNCKAIIPWYNVAERSLKETINCKNFENKIHTIPFAIKSTKIKKSNNKKTINFLFVSSINNPLDFEFKGGILALEVYSQLVKKYPNLIFTIRAHIPRGVEKKYKNLPGLKFIKEFISTEKLEKLFLDSDILLQPKPGTQLMLECMNYAIPGIAFDIWEVPEMMQHNKNALLVDCSPIYGPSKTKQQFQNFMKNHHLNYLKMYMKQWPQNIVQDFTQQASKLIEDKKLRIKMSQYAKSLVTNPGSPHNFENRNKKLLEVFEGGLGK